MLLCTSGEVPQPAPCRVTRQADVEILEKLSAMSRSGVRLLSGASASALPMGSGTSHGRPASPPEVHTQRVRRQTGRFRSFDPVLKVEFQNGLFEGPGWRKPGWNPPIRGVQVYPEDESESQNENSGSNASYTRWHEFSKLQSVRPHSKIRDCEELC